MVKVRILLTTASSAALVLPVLAGCSAEATDDVGEVAQQNTQSIAGSGALTVQGWRVNYASTTGGDEFVRVGEKMKVVIDHMTTVNMVAGSDSALWRELKDDPSKLTVELEVRYTSFDEASQTAPRLPVRWAREGGITAGTSDEFVIPKGVKRLAIDLVASYQKNGATQTVRVLSTNSVRREVVVFGAFAPNKLALFDTAGAQRRTRLVEGGEVVRGSTLLLSVTDWRLDTVVDKSTLDLYVGDRQSGGRFGPLIVPAFGELEYEVSAVVSTDGGGSYQPLGLRKVVRPDVLGGNADMWRYALEAQAVIPRNAGPSLKTAFHVRAFLKVPNERLINGRYEPGARILLRETWDNNGGQNYALPIGGE